MARSHGREEALVPADSRGYLLLAESSRHEAGLDHRGARHRTLRGRLLVSTTHRVQLAARGSQHVRAKPLVVSRASAPSCVGGLAACSWRSSSVWQEAGASRC